MRRRPWCGDASGGGVVFALRMASSMSSIVHRSAGRCPVHYVDVGSGDTLLFLHGNPAWSFQWRDLIDGLRGQFRLRGARLPGFGWSSAPPATASPPPSRAVSSRPWSIASACMT